MSINDAIMYCFAFFPCFIDHIFFVSDFRTNTMLVFSRVFHIPSPLLLLHLVFSLLEAREESVHEIVMVQ